ncbi:alpha/beta fold hydrolase [Streptomyces sp. TRM64462]|uniref:alpha/beta fold hydrolase n=1 Tax=Streptomyces sp. TRM64462 TaxID=2741726 RepID=UPI0015867446|nr:alpha/beta hydrolase [Streptomyces sp. TRM64462]
MRALRLPGAGGHIRWLDLPGREGDGRVVVFLHGLGCAGTADYPQVAAQPELAGSRAVVVDLLGHGYSDRPEAFGYSLHDHARSVAAVLDHCGIRGAALVGHSMGGAVAIVLASERPELFSRVVVAEPNWHAGGGLYSRAVAAYTEADFSAYGFGEVLAGYEPAYAARVRVTAPFALHRSAVGLVRGTEPDMGARFLALPHARALVVGARSRPYEDEDVMREAGVPVLEVPEAGHDLSHDNPRGFAAALAAALALGVA